MQEVDTQWKLSRREAEETPEGMKQEVLSSRTEPRSRDWKARKHRQSRWSRKLETSERRCVRGVSEGAGTKRK